MNFIQKLPFHREKNLTFGQAIYALKGGKAVRRTGWNGKRMFVFMRPPATILQEEILKVKSLPIEVSRFLAGKTRLDGMKHGEQATAIEDVSFLPYFCMYSANGEIVNGWLASQTDMQATDWEIVKFAA